LLIVVAIGVCSGLLVLVVGFVEVRAWRACSGMYPEGVSKRRLHAPVLLRAAGVYMDVLARHETCPAENTQP
jgi:hypothetical protein